jgi:alkanesulfonate monooxygenase SsuD/methylene tetrahydromethanopterin reductase-like flavin-dependent oxidoreductase (luciferase family)
VRFGLFYQLPVARDQSEARRYAETVEQIVRGDELGFGAAWLAEGHFLRSFSALPAPLTFAAALSGRTERIRLGTSVVQLPLYHPVRVAEEAAMVDILSGGRLELGVGRGFSSAQFGAFGVPFSERHTRFEEALDIIEGAFSGAPLHHEGRHHRLDGPVVSPRPLQRPRPPIGVAANSPRTAEFAGSRGYGMMMSAAVHPLPGAFAEHARAYRNALAGAERPTAGASLSAVLWVFVGEDRVEVRRRMEGSLAHHPIGAGLPWEVAEEGMAVFGSPEDCARKIRAIAGLAPLDELTCWFNPGGLVPHEQVLEAMELFAKEVMPEVRNPSPAEAAG